MTRKSVDHYSRSLAALFLNNMRKPLLHTNTGLTLIYIQAEAATQREEKLRGSKRCVFLSVRQDQGSVGVVCLDRKLASIPLPVDLQEVEIRDKTQGKWT